MAKPQDMYQCQTVDCGYVYDPDRGDKRRKTFLQERPLVIFLMTGIVRVVGRGRRCFVLLLDRGVLQRNRAETV